MMPDISFTNNRIYRDSAFILAGCICALVLGVSTASPQSGESARAAPRATGSSCESIPLNSIDDAKDLARALQGHIAGMDIFSASGHAGSGSRVRMRGNASVAASNEPLVVVDDIPMRSVLTGSITRHAEATRTMNPLDFVDPSDVVRIEVLRGPAATTMYGMEAANGAIRIYTRRGEKKGGTQANSQVRCPS